MPANSETSRLEEFFRCAAVLMTDSLQLLGLNSMQDFTLLLCSPPVSLAVLQHPLFDLKINYLTVFQRLYERITVDKQFSGHISFARPKVSWTLIVARLVFIGIVCDEVNHSNCYFRPRAQSRCRDLFFGWCWRISRLNSTQQ